MVPFLGGAAQLGGSGGALKTEVVFFDTFTTP